MFGASAIIILVLNPKIIKEASIVLLMSALRSLTDHPQGTGLGPQAFWGPFKTYV